MNHNEKTLRTYQQLAKDYAQLNNGNQRMSTYHKRFKSFIQHGNVYDVGCGTGRDVEALSQLGFNVTGVDASFEMLEVAKRSYPNRSFQELNLLTDVDTLPKVDGLWACASLLHFTKDEFNDVFQKLVKKLNDHGVMYLSLKLKDLMYTEEINGRFFQYYTSTYLKDYFDSLNLVVLFEEESMNATDTFGNYFLTRKKALS